VHLPNATALRQPDLEENTLMQNYSHGNAQASVNPLCEIIAALQFCSHFC